MSLLEQLMPATGEVVLDRYRLGEELGRGGFGLVFRATHLSLDEDVAVKVLLPHVAADEALHQRFEREVRVAKGLRHPNTVRILDSGRTAAGLPFFVMEFIDGRPLKSVIRDVGRLSPARTRRIANQVLGSLSEAHAHGVVHRDLKPSNIILTEVIGTRDFVKVLDFGIAKALVKPGESLLETQTGMVLGTLNYMSPEQAAGRRDVDARADLYSVGLVMAECLSGRTIVEASSPLEVLVRHTSSEPHTFPAVVRHSPLWKVIRHATSKDRETRYESALAMVEALDHLGELSDEPLTDLMMGVPLGKVSDASARRRAEPQTADAAPGPAATAAPSESAIDHEADTWIDDARDAAPPESGDGHLHTADTLVAIPDAEAASADVSRELARLVRSPRRRAMLAVGIALLLGLVVILVTRDAGRPEPGESGEATAAGSRSAEEPAADAPTEHRRTGATDESATAFAERSAEVLAARASAVAVAADRVERAAPRAREMRFRGTDGTEVRLGDSLLGVIPFEGLLPVTTAPLELRFERPGYRSLVRSVALDQPLVEVLLRPEARETAAVDEETGSEREALNQERSQPAPGVEETGAPVTPFGHAPLDLEGADQGGEQDADGQQRRGP